MKQKFVNATLSDRRKGKELCAEVPIKNPHREVIISEDPSKAPVFIPPKKAPAPLPGIPDLDKLKAELEKLSKPAKKAPAPVPRSRIIGPSMASSAPEADPAKQAGDILAILMGRK